MAIAKQRTFKVGEQKITIRSVARTSCGNPCGYYVYINGTKYYHNGLYREAAEDSAYAKWVKEHA